MRSFLALFASAMALVAAEDPASGWMGYARGTIPNGTERITKLEMTWTVPSEGPRSIAFYAPWFGMDPIDNKNLLQPVNPWSGVKKHWSMYTEYFQFSPIKNSNSETYPVEAGQTLRGSIVHNEAEDSYLLSHTIIETGDMSSQVVKCQKGKKYVIPYVVFEKKFKCSWYPPDGAMTFHNITVECDGVDCSRDVQWEAKVKDDHCNHRAVIDADRNEVTLTWDTSATSSIDNLTLSEMVALNADGWGAAFVRESMKELELQQDIADGVVL